MRKFICVLLGFCLVIGFVGCASSRETSIGDIRLADITPEHRNTLIGIINNMARESVLGHIDSPETAAFTHTPTWEHEWYFGRNYTVNGVVIGQNFSGTASAMSFSVEIDLDDEIVTLLVLDGVTINVTMPEEAERQIAQARIDALQREADRQVDEGEFIRPTIAEIQTFINFSNNFTLTEGRFIWGYGVSLSNLNVSRVTSGVMISDGEMNYPGLSLTYRGNSWIYFDRITLEIDGVNVELSFDQEQVSRRTVTNGISETVGVHSLDIMRQLAEADEVVVHFLGESNREHTMNRWELNGIKLILELYDMVQARPLLMEHIDLWFE